MQFPTVEVTTGSPKPFYSILIFSLRDPFTKRPTESHDEMQFPKVEVKGKKREKAQCLTQSLGRGRLGERDLLIHKYIYSERHIHDKTL